MLLVRLDDLGHEDVLNDLSIAWPYPFVNLLLTFQVSSPLWSLFHPLW